MKFPKLISVVVAFVLFATTHLACAQWESFRGPDTFRTSDIESHGPYLFASTNEGIFRSVDDGQEWVPVNSGLPMDTIFYELATIGTDIFAVTERHDKWRVLRSTDKSENWTAASTGLPNGYLGSLVAVGDRLFVHGEDWGEDCCDHIYQSTDYGRTWQLIGGEEDLRLSEWPTIAVKDNVLFVATNYGIYRSADHGENWTQVTTDLNVNKHWVNEEIGLPDRIEILSLSATDDNLFASARVSEVIRERPLGGHNYTCYGCADFVALFKSSDNGHSWTLLNWEPESENVGGLGFLLCYCSR